MMLDIKNLALINRQLGNMINTVNKMLVSQVDDSKHKVGVTQFQTLRLQEQANELIDYIREIATKEVNQDE